MMMVSIASLRALLPRCMIAPQFINNKDGCRLLAFYFGLHVPLIDELFAAIKSQVSFYPLSS